MRKHCPGCGQELLLSEFTHDKRRRDGLSFYCKICARLRLRRSQDAKRGGPPTHRYPRDIDVPAGYKWCPDCATVKALDDFPVTRAKRGGRHSYGKPCHNARGRASLEKVGGARTYHLKRRYGITADDADKMLVTHGGLCAICRERPAEHIDHDHATGAVRGLLCFNCNGGLGQFRDDTELLDLAIDYLDGHRPPTGDGPVLERLSAMKQPPTITPEEQAARVVLLTSSAANCSR